MHPPGLGTALVLLLALAGLPAAVLVLAPGEAAAARDLAVLGLGALLAFGLALAVLRAGIGQSGPSDPDPAAQRAVEAALAEAQARERAARAALAEAQRRLDEMDRVHGQFVNLAAHELSNPLTPIAMQVHMLRTSGAGHATEEQMRSLAILDRNVARLGRLTRDVLDASRLQAGELRLARARFDLRDVLGETLESFRDAAGEAGVGVEGEWREALPVDADPQRVAQVLSNLIGNAVKFSSPGGRVRVFAVREGSEVAVRVTDTGRGFAADEALRLFEPFSRLPSNGGPSGAGLGLFVTRGIVEQHGGRVWASSEGPGKGATFGFALPLVAAVAEPAPRGAFAVPATP